jgi:hypothetical protein
VRLARLRHSTARPVLEDGFGIARHWTLVTSTTVTSCPRRPSSSAAIRSPHPPPMTTIFTVSSRLFRLT